MQITVSGFEQKGNFHKLVTTNREKFGIKDPAAFQVGKTYEVQYSERDVAYNGKTFKARDITSASPVAQTNGNGKHIETPTRELWMARECALRASVEMVEAIVELSVASTIPLDESLHDIQKRYYAEFLAEITK